MAGIETARLILRPWKPKDYAPFAALNTDPKVMAYFPKRLTRPESDALADSIQRHIEEKGYGLWAAARKDTGDFIGFVGLHGLDLPLPFCPAVEIGWRLAKGHWGQGFATEAAQACLAYAFEKANLDRVVSITALENKRSQKVMQRIGLHHDPTCDFDHPNLPPKHWLSKHVCYSLGKDEWVAKRG